METRSFEAAGSGIALRECGSGFDRDRVGRVPRKGDEDVGGGRGKAQPENASPLLAAQPVQLLLQGVCGWHSFSSRIEGSGFKV